jgi:hypothetical protein
MKWRLVHFAHETQCSDSVSNPRSGSIGVHEPRFRSRCIKLGEALGLYKDEHVAKNCTPSYLPDFIRIEVAKRD